MATLVVSKFLSLLGISSNTSHILQIHAQLITRSLVSDHFLSTRLLLALCESSSPAQSWPYADLIFFRIHNPNTFAWNTIIRLHTLAANPRRALLLFAEMRENGIPADLYTYPFVLKACGLMPGSREGEVVHGGIVKTGFDMDLFARNALISFYCRLGKISPARCLFDGFGTRDLVSWNTMIAGYVANGMMGDAQKLFDEMPLRDTFSWAVLIDGYGKRAGDVTRARELFDKMEDKDLVCWNSMIDGYASFGGVGYARELFEAMPKRNVISWSIMIDSYVRHGDPKEALVLFQRMLWQGTKPDKVSAVGVITACGQLGALDQGQWVHSYLKKNKILFDVVVQTSLIDMYMKCGSLGIARRLFDSMPERSVVSWNVMMVGLGNNGRGDEALELFCRMEREGVNMDDLTLLGILTACTHGGLVDEGLKIFDRMTIDFNIIPKVEHYGCVVDLLGRAGRLDEARNLIDTIPVEPTSALWGSLLSACRTHRYVDMAELSVKRLVDLGADDSGVYVLLSNIYAEEAMWDDVSRIRRLISDRGMKKESGRSVVEVDGCVHEFVNGDSSHLFKEEIYMLIWSLISVISAPR